MGLSTLIGTLGSAGIGFVLGWTLYFANRGKSGNLSVAEIASIAGVIAGSTVVAFLNGFGTPETDRAFLFGGYGIGVCIGFLTYYLLLRSALGKEGSDAGIALQSFRGDGLPRSAQQTARQIASGPARFARQRQSGQGGSRAAAIRAAEAMLDDLIERRKRARDPSHAEYDLEEADKIRAHQKTLKGILYELYMADVVAQMSSDEIRVFLDALETETEALSTEAARLKDASKNLDALNGTINALNTFITELRNN